MRQLFVFNSKGLMSIWGLKIGVTDVTNVKKHITTCTI